MCGIAGLWDFQGTTSDKLALALDSMTAKLRHRGPDAGAIWLDAAAGLGLGHRRLSILDLSPAGAQPMVSANEQFVVAYNGEGYNADDLRAELVDAGHRFRGHSDTEVLVEGFSRWGVEGTVRRFNGMFAFAVWDRAERRLILARDRLGIKPLYWAKRGELLLFGSELKALRAHSAFRPEVDRNAAAAFLRHNYVPCPHTIYADVYKLPPGHLLVAEADGSVRVLCYWDIQARRGSVSLRDHEAVDRLEALLTDAVHRQMVSDVPLGAFLSGGIDSSTVVALMRKKVRARVRTFSIGFGEEGYDESRHAAAVAAHLGTEHTEMVAQPSHALDLIPQLAEHWDEPFADSSQLPTLLLAKLARDHVTVALSGDGGDELFAGYNRYFWSQTLRRRLGWIPPRLRMGLASALHALPPSGWDQAARLIPARLRPPQPGDKAHKLAEVLGLDEMALYRRLVSHWAEPETVVVGAQSEPKGPLWDPEVERLFPDPVERMQYLDTVTYLPDDILTKVDRATMAVSLEARVPLLDHRVVEFAWTLPAAMKIRHGQGKWVLRQVLYRYLPRELVDRPKMGFGVPIGTWLKGPLRDWAEDLLDEVQLRQGGLVDANPVRILWAEHLAGRRNWQYLLWDVLMLEAWRRRWMG